MTAPTEHLSWLTLERLHVGDLSPSAADAAQKHLQTCAACQSNLHTITADQRPLRPLMPAPASAPVFAPHNDALPSMRAPKKRWWVPSVLAAAAAVCVVVVMWPEPPPAYVSQDTVLPTTPHQLTPKGGARTLTVIRERAGLVTAQPQSYRAGDRFRLEVSCSPPAELRWRVEIKQGQQTFDPYPEHPPVLCQNNAAIPGAFRMTTGGEPVTICLQDDPAAAAANAPRLCVELTPE